MAAPMVVFVQGMGISLKLTLKASKQGLPIRRAIVEPFCKHIATKRGVDASPSRARASAGGVALDLDATPRAALSANAVVDLVLEPAPAVAAPLAPVPVPTPPRAPAQAPRSAPSEQPTREAAAIPEPARPEREGDAILTWTCTFNGRLGAFFETLASFVRETAPASQRMIRDWVVIADRGATAAQRAAIITRAPWLTLVCKGPPLHRHPMSINLLLEAFVKTRWWLEWEDDWVCPPGCGAAPGGDLVQRALAVQRHCGATQVALNGAFLDIPEDCPDYAVARSSAGPVNYATVALGAAAHDEVVSCASTEALAVAMAPARDPALFGKPGACVPPWPLFSLQPSLLDAAYVREHMYPFARGAHMNDQDAYWLWELEAALDFVKHGATKASIDSRLVARQIDVETSSLDSPEDRAAHAAPARAAKPKAANRKFAVKRR